MLLSLLETLRLMTPESQQSENLLLKPREKGVVMRDKGHPETLILCALQGCRVHFPDLSHKQGAQEEAPSRPWWGPSPEVVSTGSSSGVGCPWTFHDSRPMRINKCFMQISFLSLPAPWAPASHLGDLERGRCWDITHTNTAG